MKRLVAIQVDGAWEGDWQQAQGNEVAVIAYPIAEGDEVRLEIEDVDGKVFGLDLTVGPRTLHEFAMSRYRVVKKVNSGSTVATSVEMVLKQTNRRGM